ncbi:MAG: ChaN family lipoprotein [Betaproteobacteria bacterium]|nr:ChaN family lipoprotein [Betaproteobacteria bacterium]
MFGNVRYNSIVPHFSPAASRTGLCALGLIAMEITAATPAGAQQSCVPAGEWSVPGAGRIAAPEILARAARAQVVLLGESHGNADHHRWELQTMAALAALRPKVVLGFEMFPRRVQGELDRWVAGELSEQEFLKASDWSRVWGSATASYLPLFHFARLNRIPMIALNVERDFVQAVRAKGFDGVPAEKREGVSRPAPPGEAYLGRLFASYSEHPQAKGRATARSDLEFLRFVEAQLVWDRAMAQALADAAARYPDALVIGIMGNAHVAHGDGVPYQLEQLGVKHVASLLPWNPNAGCDKLSAGLATAVFGLPAARPGDAPPRQRLGITVETASDGVHVAAVEAGSIAEAAGLRVGDVLIEIAGTPVKVPAEVRAIVDSMVPGTWLPLKAERQREFVELTAKFPAR